jgi:FtsP/CotA-like multicopper oxidase with cupredoxin domain
MLTRRDLLKLGILTGGYSLVDSGSRGRRLLAQDGGFAPSPQLAAFVQPLPMPAGAPKVPAFLPFDCGTGGYIGADTTFHRIVEEEAFVSVHPDLPDTRIWRYRPLDEYGRKVSPWGALGPTFRARAAENCGAGLVVRKRNELPEHHIGFGVPETTTHFHGGHHPAEYDGFPENIHGIGFVPVIKPGQEYDYVFPMRDPGFRHGAPDRTDRGSTLWYHDHLFDFTAANVVRGLCGFYLVFDEKDSDNESDTSSEALRLPSGSFDIPVCIQDRRFGYDGQLLYDPLEHEGFLGDTFLVNGAVQPYLDVQRRKYRFRFLNGSNARFYRIVLAAANGTSLGMTQIATEGGLLAAPIPGIRHFTVGSAERVEVVIDFRDVPSGTRLYFENRLQQDEGRKPGDVLSRGTRLVELRVNGPQVTDPSRVPAVLRPFPKISDEELSHAVRKSFKFERTHGSWAINGQLANLEHALTSSDLNRGEIWHLESGGGWAHPVHIHLEFCRILRRDGRLPPLAERDGMGKKETIVIGDDFGDVDLFVKFRDYTGPYVFHCHNIEHEDMRMMARMDMR